MSQKKIIVFSRNIFNDNGLVNSRFLQCLKKSNTKWKGRCTFFSKKINSSNMGICIINKLLIRKKVH